MNENTSGTPAGEVRKVPVPVFQGVPTDEAPAAPVVRAVNAMAGPVFTAPQG